MLYSSAKPFQVCTSADVVRVRKKMTEAMKSATREVGYPNLKPNQFGALNVIKGDIILHEAIIVACYHTS